MNGCGALFLYLSEGSFHLTNGVQARSGSGESIQVKGLDKCLQNFFLILWDWLRLYQVYVFVRGRQCAFCIFLNTYDVFPQHLRFILISSSAGGYQYTVRDRAYDDGSSRTWRYPVLTLDLCAHP
jgi:hypothetical protein